MGPAPITTTVTPTQKPAQLGATPSPAGGLRAQLKGLPYEQQAAMVRPPPQGGAAKPTLANDTQTAPDQAPPAQADPAQSGLGQPATKQDLSTLDPREAAACAPAPVITEPGRQPNGRAIELDTCARLKVVASGPMEGHYGIRDPKGRLVVQGRGPEVHLDVVAWMPGTYRIVDLDNGGLASDVQLAVTRLPVDPETQPDAQSPIQEEAATRWGVLVDRDGFKPESLELLESFGVNPIRYEPAVLAKLVDAVDALMAELRSNTIHISPDEGLSCVRLEIRKSFGNERGRFEYLLQLDDGAIRLLIERTESQTSNQLAYTHRDGTLLEAGKKSAVGEPPVPSVEGTNFIAPMSSPGHEPGADPVADHAEAGPEGERTNRYEDLMTAEHEGEQWADSQRPGAVRRAASAVAGGVATFGKTLYHGGKHFKDAVGLDGASASIEAGEKQQRVGAALTKLYNNPGRVARGIELLVQATSSDVVQRRYGEQLAQAQEQVDGALSQWWDEPTDYSEVAGAVLKSEGTHNLAASAAGKIVAKMVTKKLAARMAVAATERLASRMAVGVGAAESGVGLPLSVVILAGEVEQSGAASARLKASDPLIYAAIAQTGLDAAWYLIEPQWPAMKAKIMAEVKRAVEAQLEEQRLCGGALKAYEKATGKEPATVE